MSSLYWKPTTKNRILLVDSDKLFLQTTKKQLKLEDYNINIFLDIIAPQLYLENKNMSKKRDNIILITEIQEPFQIGFEILNIIEKIYQNIHIIATGYFDINNTPNESECKYLKKPIKLSNLRKVIQDCHSNNNNPTKK